VYPKDIYTLAVLSIISLPQMKQKKRQLCGCGCGQLAPSGKKYVSKKHARRTYGKQNALSYFRTQKKRGKISEEQYEKIKEEINQAAKEGIRDKEELIERGKTILDFEG